jgi:hypothetical protein
MKMRVRNMYYRVALAVLALTALTSSIALAGADPWPSP